MKLYADSNFFTRIYLIRPGSEEAAMMLAKIRGKTDLSLPVTWLHRLEIVNAFEQLVFLSRQLRQAHVTPERAAIAQANFRDDLVKSEFLTPFPLPPEKLVSAFEEISLRHTSRHGFRTYDLIHVASALLMDCDTFWSFDQKAAKLAGLEGLKVQP